MVARLLALLFVSLSLLLPVQDRPIGKLHKGQQIMFRLQDQGKTPGEFVLEPMLPTSIFGIVSTAGGESPKVGDVFSCTAGSKTLGKILGPDNQPTTTTSSILILDCGKYTFFIEGIQFTPEE